MYSTCCVGVEHETHAARLRYRMSMSCYVTRIFNVWSMTPRRINIRNKFSQSGPFLKPWSTILDTTIKIHIHISTFKPKIKFQKMSNPPIPNLSIVFFHPLHNFSIFKLNFVFSNFRFINRR